MGFTFQNLSPVRKAAFVSLALGTLIIVSALGSFAAFAGIHAAEPDAFERSPFPKMFGDPKSRSLGQVVVGLAVLVSGAGLWFYKPWSVVSLALLAIVCCGVMVFGAVKWWVGFPGSNFGSIGNVFRVAGVGMAMFWVAVIIGCIVHLVSPGFRSQVKGQLDG